jgi:hypothetical protein
MHDIRNTSFALTAEIGNLNRKLETARQDFEKRLEASKDNCARDLVVS